MRYSQGQDIRRQRRFLLTALLVFGLPGPAAIAQDLSPRAYWPAPDGTNVLVVAYQHSSGDIVFDPSLPITGVDSRNDIAQFAFQRFFGIFGRSGSLQFALPFADGKTEGYVDDIYRSRKVSGMGDMTARFAINLKGAPSMDPQAFVALLRNPETIVGASLTVQVPTGVYNDARLINIGSNRWAAKPALGMIVPVAASWLLELEVGAWIFGKNEDFVGTVRRQDPIASAQAHLIKVITPAVWVSLDATYYEGGRTSTDRISNADLQRNSRAGVAALFPVKGRHALRLSYSTGLAVSAGGDFDQYSLSYVYAWR